MSVLPRGFGVRVRPDVKRLGGDRVLLGGSPLRAVTLSPRARSLMRDDRLVVRDEASDLLARRLLRGNLADPDGLGQPVLPSQLTVIVPVRDRPEQLARCLDALRGLEVIVVDDASRAPSRTREVAADHGARVVALDANLGPSGARNAGIAAASTPYLAFVDSDVTVSAAALLELSRHMQDPRVALVGPLIQARRSGEHARWFERYEEVAGSLALGTRSCEVRPGAAVAWLPSACMLARRSAIGSGFSASMRVGEDVDLVWRLAAAGHVVRYEPGVVAHHDTRSTVTGWLGRKFVYGSGAGDLAARHGDAVAPAVLAPLGAAAAGALLVRSPWAVPAALGALMWGARSVRTSLPPVHGRDLQSLRLAAQGLGWAVRQESALLVRHWWPAAVVAATASRRARRALVSAVLVDSVVALHEHRGAVAPVLWGRRLDDAAYGSGLWWGALKRGRWRCLAVRWVRRGSP